MKNLCIVLMISLLMLTISGCGGAQIRGRFNGGSSGDTILNLKLSGF